VVGLAPEPQLRLAEVHPDGLAKAGGQGCHWSIKQAVRFSRLPLSISFLAFNVQANNLDQSNGDLNSFGMKFAQPNFFPNFL
jgi:hypothetical protein